MSQVRTIDGQTGELVGGYTSNTAYNVSSTNYGYSSQQPVNTYGAVTTTTQQQPVTYTTTTTTQQPATYTTTTNYVPGSTSHVQGGYTTSAVNSGYAVGSHEAQVVNTVVNTGK